MSFGQERCDSELENAIFQTPRQDYTLTVPSVDEVYFSTRELRPLARQLVAAVSNFHPESLTFELGHQLRTHRDR